MTFRAATAHDVGQMLDWAAEEGWNPGLDDAAAFYAADPKGFFVAELADAPVAAISVVNHSDTYAFLGLYLCRPEYRGKGIGYALWQHALEHANGRTVGLDGVPAQEANYAKSGFGLADRTRRLEGTLPASTPTFCLADPGDFRDLERLDATANGVMRPRFLSAWCDDIQTRKTVVLHNEAEIVGFATARVCRKGCKIGPVIAPTAQDAWHLAQQAAAAVDAQNVIIDVPDRSAEFGALLRRRGFTESFATARMYRGPAPEIGATLQAVATLELG